MSDVYDGLRQRYHRLFSATDYDHKIIQAIARNYISCRQQNHDFRDEALLVRCIWQMMVRRRSPS